MSKNPNRQKLIAAIRILIKLLIGWLMSLFRVLLLLCHRWRVAQERRRRHKWPVRCHTYPSDQWVRPDVYIYSQSWLMSQGMSVVWNNPDIELQDAGVPVPSNQLHPDKEYDIVASVHNRSVSSPAIGVGVSFSYRNWGIGGGWISIGQTKVDVSVVGGAVNPAPARVMWRTPPTPGHYCIRCKLTPPDDLDWADNEGQENTDVVAVSPGDPDFQIPVYNDTDQEMAVVLQVDAYELPKKPLPPGVDPAFLKKRGIHWKEKASRVYAAEEPIRKRTRSKMVTRTPWDWLFGGGDPDFLAKQIASAREWCAKRIQEVIQANALGKFPVPPEWNVVLANEIRLTPKSQTDLPFSFRVPLDAPAGHEQVFNIAARDQGGNLLGGVTVIARVKGS
jgi:hypothetical protein